MCYAGRGDDVSSKTVPIQQCNYGDVLAQDIKDNNGSAVVTKNTIINKFIIEKLIDLELTEVCIYMQAEDDNIIENEKIKREYILAKKSMKSILNKMGNNKPVDYSEVVQMSKIIYSYRERPNQVVQYLNSVKNHDEYTYTHSLNTAFYCMLISKWMHMSETETSLSIQAGILHDIGKIDIPENILNKRGILTKAEFEIMKLHVNHGYNRMNNFINDSVLSEEIRMAALLHHERTDGSGYPFNMSSGNINFHSKIVAIADVFDAMTSDRVYKKRTSPFDVFEMFRTIGLSMFDENIINVFIKNISGLYTNTNVLVEDGRIAQVVHIPMDNISKPVIRIDSEMIDLSKENNIRLLRVI